MNKRPNFVIIHTDQQRYDCIGIANRRRGIYTPYIDSIAYQGANFTTCYGTCPLCIPQRMSLLTGQLPAHHGLYGNVGIPYFPLETSLPTEMRRGGYQTALVGRNMHTYPANESYGFEYYLPGDPSSENKNTTDAFFKYIRDNHSSEAGGYYGNGIMNNSRAAAPFHLSEEYHHTKWATNRALEFLDNRDPSRPFMLFAGYYAPHSPHNPPKEFFNRYYFREDLDDPYIGDWEVPPVNNGDFSSSYINLKDESLRVTRAGYYGNIAFLDAQLGRLLTHPALDRKNTYIIFTSDHGDLLGDHYLYQKNRPYEGATHIPLCIMGPNIEACQTIDNPVGWHDLMPTILELADVNIPASVDGFSLAPLLQNKPLTKPWRKFIHGECVHHFENEGKKPISSEKINLYYEKGSHYLTDGHIKYIWFVTSGEEQLFNLDTDWKEQYNLAKNSDWEQILLLWRGRLIVELNNRQEGYCKNGQLIKGIEPRTTSCQIENLVKQRIDEGFRLAYTPSNDSTMAKLQYENNLMT